MAAAANSSPDSGTAGTAVRSRLSYPAVDSGLELQSPPAADSVDFL